jgi:hypothetical protein
VQFSEDAPLPPAKSYNLDFLDNLDDQSFNPFATKTNVVDDINKISTQKKDDPKVDFTHEKCQPSHNIENKELKEESILETSNMISVDSDVKGDKKLVEEIKESANDQANEQSLPTQSFDESYTAVNEAIEAQASKESAMEDSLIDALESIVAEKLETIDMNTIEPVESSGTPIASEDLNVETPCEASLDTKVNEEDSKSSADEEKKINLDLIHVRPKEKPTAIVKPHQENIPTGSEDISDTVEFDKQPLTGSTAEEPCTSVDKASSVVSESMPEEEDVIVPPPKLASAVNR